MNPGNAGAFRNSGVVVIFAIRTAYGTPHQRNRTAVAEADQASVATGVPTFFRCTGVKTESQAILTILFDDRVAAAPIDPGVVAAGLAADRIADGLLLSAFAPIENRDTFAGHLASIAGISLAVSTAKRFGIRRAVALGFELAETVYTHGCLRTMGIQGAFDGINFRNTFPVGHDQRPQAIGNTFIGIGDFSYSANGLVAGFITTAQIIGK